MKRILAVLLAGLMMLCVMSGCSDEKTDSTPDEADSNYSEEPETEEPLTLYEIKTDYAVLKFPEKYKDDVEVKIDNGDPYTVSFLSGDTLLFALGFNGGKGDVVGTIIGDSSNTVVRVDLPTLDKKAKNYDKLFEIQEQLGIILTGLTENYTFVAGEVPEEDVAVYEIPTPVVNLYYPEKWKNNVTVDIVDNTAKFSSSGTPLFDIVFGDGKGNLVGKYDGKEVRIVDYPLEDEKLSDMQQDVNVILDYLKKDSKYVSE